ncbi:MAG: hypothetical protein O7G83_03420 [Proteobacteria bacterium]|nr:hypothetical protein [Pseudomonadota bacterium]
MKSTNHRNLSRTKCARPKMLRSLGVMAMSLFRRIISKLYPSQLRLA